MGTDSNCISTDRYGLSQNTATPKKMAKEITLRPYQEESAEKSMWALNKFDDNSLVVISQGGGKTLVIAEIANRLDHSTAILSPSREILQQTHNKLSQYVDESEIGIFSASFNKKEFDKPYTLATVQSIYKHPELFQHVKVILFDECDLWNYQNDSGMFNKFLAKINYPKILGFTGTPFRNVTISRKVAKEKGGGFSSATYLKLINRTKPQIWHRLLYNINNSELTEQGFLTPVEYDSRTIIDHKKIPTNSGRTDFDLELFSNLLEPYEEEILEDTRHLESTRARVLVFCASLKQAERFNENLPNSGFVSGTTPVRERDNIVSRFKSGEIKTVVNVGTMTTGLDVPELDTVVFVRPTKSLRLYGQCIGRCTRLAEGKEKSLVVDYSDTFTDFGALKDIVLKKDERNQWELYANGTPRHNKLLFNYSVDSDNKPRKGIKIKGKRI